MNDVLSNDQGAVEGVRCTRKVGDERIDVEYFAPLTFIVDGCFSKFRAEVPHREVFVRSHFVGAILENCPLPMPNHGHVILASPSPILLYQIGSNDTRVLVDVPGKVPSVGSGALKAYMLEHVMPQLPLQTQKSFQEAVESQRLRVMPNSFLPATDKHRHGVIVVGDALNMRHPLTGGGMTVGFNDALLLSRCLTVDNCPSFTDHDSVKSCLNTFLQKRKAHCSVINILAQALYELFSAGENADLQVLRQACFGYFELGGICVRHPIGLLSGLIKRPMVLFTHFFAVAFYGMSQLLNTPLAAFKPLLASEETISNAFNANPVQGAVMFLVHSLLFVVAILISLPVNLLRGLKVVFTASCVILPLIWSEFHL